MKPRKPLSLAVAAATLLTASFSPSASAELTDREASIVPIAAFTANGNQEQLKKALAKGLDNGLTVNEIKAVLEQMYAYTGFPRSLTALGVYVKLLDERKAAGLKDTVGREPTPLPESADLRISFSQGGNPAQHDRRYRLLPDRIAVRDPAGDPCSTQGVESAKISFCIFPCGRAGGAGNVVQHLRRCLSPRAQKGAKKRFNPLRSKKPHGAQSSSAVSWCSKERCRCGCSTGAWRRTC